MQHVPTGKDCLDYSPCGYEGSRLQFRGPCRDLQRDHVICIGSTETYGRFISAPWPDLLDRELGLDCVNLGVVNAGIDSFLHDPGLSQILAGAKAVVIQAMGAHNLSNRYYSVHPRRNDRFLSASPTLALLYPEVDFTEFHFTRHMLSRLHAICEKRSAAVFRELKSAWIARMTALCALIPGPVLLLWISDRLPPERAEEIGDCEPLLVTREMLEALRPHLAGQVEIAAPRGVFSGTDQPLPGFSAPAAAVLPGPAAHERAAAELLPLLRDLLPADLRHD
ncbi:DUF6473 family protein [Allosediminivita pacifica]|uniref:DUF6473 domain-containing protein n=1 Tax=Allosediminivita pacifica TaxID=1267769 RepID=A0A2T6APL0_9RHOB|nr:DUF6473 family protein [Allosediminivita pacifica]PTX45686.1 hypothetical protein C8N44_12040 [Allosediminivita pacifica]GGB07173.1 hypothetical protein GCM10011324_16630 [Allosediminivita pacifica]